MVPWRASVSNDVGHDRRQENERVTEEVGWREGFAVEVVCHCSASYSLRCHYGQPIFFSPVFFHSSAYYTISKLDLNNRGRFSGPTPRPDKTRLWLAHGLRIFPQGHDSTRQGPAPDLATFNFIEMELMFCPAVPQRKTKQETRVRDTNGTRLEEDSEGEITFPLQPGMRGEGGGEGR